MSKNKPHWHISFDIDPQPVMTLDGRVTRKATAIAKRGDVAYMAELELENWAEDMAAFFEQAKSVFFEADTRGLPVFPEMEADDPPQQEPEAEPQDDTPPEEEKPDPVTNGKLAHDDDGPYQITFYPAES
ncbi:MAG: hypothetical protein ACFB51_13030 [Anaerolineae bacterium]